ncbi:MAG: hypothetical protein M3277_10560 [Actinomycetota bacterium]|nr:hypothetical protein [Actinomycetota bacterium]
MWKRRLVALVFAGALFAACGTDDTGPEPPEPVATEEADTGGGGMMDDQDLDY